MSESIGLWLLYALEKGDQALFDQSFQVLQSVFLTPEGWIYWKVAEQGSNVTTNALIDDLRIAEALFKAAAYWENERYLQLAKKISSSVVKFNVVNDMFVDFYDIEAKWATSQLTLSYINTFALREMYEQRQINEQLYQNTINFMHQIPLQHGFFPFSYDVELGVYTYHEEVNLIDQLYVYYHLIHSGADAPELWDFIQETFYDKGLLFGRYEVKSKLPSVSYESAAVYGLTILAAIERGDYEFAQDVYYRLIRHQTLNPEHPYYGGFVDHAAQDTHIFDNLIPLLAERKMYHAQILY